MRFIWAFAGLVSLALALIGIVLPLLPTAPFLLLAAFCFARSSERLHFWLINHKTLGPPILEWQECGAINPRGKRLATLSIAVVFGISLAIGLRPMILGIQALCLAGVLTFIWTRPSA